MKLTVFQAGDGDCLLLIGATGTTILADGGRSGTYTEHVAPSLSRLDAPLDLVYVSHIDADHIEGILRMVDDYIDWRAFDFQSAGGNPRARRPKSHRPPDMSALWHNAFQDQVGENEGVIEDLLVNHMRACLTDTSLAGLAAHYDNLITSKRQALRLSRLIGKQVLDIPLNPDFGGRLMHIGDPATVIPLGGLQISIIGPSTEILGTLRDEWNEWVRNDQEGIQKIREKARREAERLHQGEDGLLRNTMLALATELEARSELGDKGSVTTPNLASLMLLVEEGDKSVLLTGDGYWQDILDGLEAHERIDQAGEQGIHVNALKVQHHGAEFNIHPDFCRFVTADHYIFCGNGEHANPDVRAVQAIIDSRIGAEAANSFSPGVGEPFRFWFNSSQQVALRERELAIQEGKHKRAEHMAELADHMAAVRECASQGAQASSGRMRFRFLTSGSKLPVIAL